MHRYFEINEGGHNIRCKVYCQDLRQIRRIVLFCHGFGGHKDNAAAEKFAERLLSKTKGAALVTFDWPCHGDDVKKKLCLGDCESYLELVTAFLRQKYEPEALFCYATSFGGYVVLKYISERGNPFGKIALRCPAVNMHDVLTQRVMTPEELERLQKGKEIPVGFDRKVMVGKPFLDALAAGGIEARDFLDFAEDILILHGTSDEIVPFASVQAFAENQLIEFIPIPEADHRFRDPKKMDRAIKEILDLFRS